LFVFSALFGEEEEEEEEEEEDAADEFSTSTD
jgi:hypothetical protein